MDCPMLKGDERAAALPRHSWAMATLGPGDVVLFAEGTSRPITINHAGIYLGVDQSGNPRFLSSRTGANGPTFGDVGGRSVLSGSGLYARDLRSAKRL